MSKPDRYEWPEAGNMGAILQAVDYYEREWHEVVGVKIDNFNPLASIERALSGLSIVSDLLAADALAVEDMEESKCEHPQHLTNQQRFQLRNAHSALLRTAHDGLANWRDRLQDQRRREQEKSQ